MADVMTQEDAMNMDERQAIQILEPMAKMMIDQHGCPISAAYFALQRAIEALSVEVVRCEDCVHWQDQEEGVVESAVCVREKPMVMEIGPYGYCSYGERRVSTASDYYDNDGRLINNQPTCKSVCGERKGDD